MLGLVLGDGGGVDGGLLGCYGFFIILDEIPFKVANSLVRLIVSCSSSRKISSRIFSYVCGGSLYQSIVS